MSESQKLSCTLLLWSPKGPYNVSKEDKTHDAKSDEETALIKSSSKRGRHRVVPTNSSSSFKQSPFAPHSLIEWKHPH